MVKNTEINLSTVSRDLKKSASEAVVIGVGQGTDGPVLLDTVTYRFSGHSPSDATPSGPRMRMAVSA